MSPINNQVNHPWNGGNITNKLPVVLCVVSSKLDQPHHITILVPQQRYHTIRSTKCGLQNEIYKLISKILSDGDSYIC